MKSSSQHTFSQIPKAEIPRSAFNRSHGYKTTFDAGYLVPIYVDEALPGDTFNLKLTSFARLATAIVPIMDNMVLDCFFFAVPNRLIWDNWQKFCGEQESPNASTDYLAPEIISPVGGYFVQSIYDYMGLPILHPGMHHSALPLRAYNLIWNQWFRDENMQASLTVPKGDGPDDASLYTVQRRGKRHDYFTSCLPWPQKGPGVELPLGTSAPVIPSAPGSGAAFRYSGGSEGWPLAASDLGGVPPWNVNINIPTTPQSGSDPLVWSDSGLIADLSHATAATINSLRQAFQIQKLLERDARGGTRYVEILRSHFGVVSPDARLQRAEYLGGGSTPVTFNPVTQTSATVTSPGTVVDTPQGNLSAYAVVGANNMGFTKSFVEHCIIIGMVCVRADISYQQGLPRPWSRRTRWDYYWPAFSHLGEQAVLTKEIWYQSQATDENVFGYQERWAEYRYFPSQITGKFRSNTPGGSLDFWHLAQEFTVEPTLSPSFIVENPPVSRIVAVTSEPQFIYDSHFAIKTVRPMPTYSVPGYIDHF